jgi:4-amino-4-deoxy-L-arabinose transferase-like glycosyltransferase
MKTSSKILLIVFFLIWIVPGLIGRDPWMNDEPYTFGLVNYISKTGDWVVPTLAGEPFVEKPPLYFLTAAAFMRIFAPLLEPHDAARLASGFYMLLILLFIGLSAKELMGERYVENTLFVLLGCTSLQLMMHKMITDVALLMGFTVALYGLALSTRRFILGGVWIGTGVGIGFMSKGLLAPGIVGITVIMLPLSFSTWRKRNYLHSLLVALAAALPWLLIWPYALFRRSPDLFREWLWVQNFGRYLGFWPGGAHNATQGFVLALGQGFQNLSLERLAIPIFPLTLWSLWCNRQSWRGHPMYQLPLTMFFVIFIVLSVSANARSLYAIPMLIPLSLIAAAGIEFLSGKAARIITWSNVILFGLTAVFLWSCWFVTVTGQSTFVTQTTQVINPVYSPSFNDIQFTAALVCTLAWLYAVIHLTHFRSPAMASWTIGVTLVWSLGMTLWLPTLNARESYREIFTSLRESTLTQYRCIASQGLDENERAMLEYYAGVLTQRIEVNAPGDCDLLLVEDENLLQASGRGPAWQLLWEEKRPRRNSKEIFRLYQQTHRGTRSGTLVLTVPFS